MGEAEWFAGRLRELRLAAGLSREELADRAGMKVGGVRDLEQAVNSPRWETVLALAKALGVECGAFVQPPQERQPDKGGRPAKPKDEPAEVKPPRKRGRPRK
jgi:transcriptional regulator with XRE-family HTH domain